MQGLSQVITTHDGPTLMLILGGIPAAKAGRSAAIGCLHRARVDLAEHRARRGTLPHWLPTGYYAQHRRYILGRIARCRAEIAKANRQIAWLMAMREPMKEAAE